MRASVHKKAFGYKPRKCVDVTINVDIEDLEGKKWKATRKIRMRLRRNWEHKE